MKEQAAAAAREMLVKHEMGHARRGLAWGALSGAVWGMDGVLLGVALALAPFAGGASLLAAPLAGAALHDGIAALWLLALNISAGKWREIGRALAVREGRIVCLAALFGGPVGMAGYLLGIAHAGAVYAMAVSAVYPAIGSVLAVVFLKERISVRAWAGIFAGIAGVVIIGWAPAAGRPPHFYLGLGFALMSALGWALESVLSTRGMDKLDPDIAINIREAVSCVVYLAVVLPIVRGHGVFTAAVAHGPMLLLAAAGFCGALSYNAWYRSMNMAGVGRAMALSITYALWSVVFTAAGARAGIAGMTFTSSPALIAGVVIITIGSALIVMNPKELLTLRAEG